MDTANALRARKIPGEFPRHGTALAFPLAYPVPVVPVTAKHVLVVDDDPQILDVVRRALASSDLRISTARRAVIARDVLTRHAIDLIISDARMPGETGLQLADKARELGIPCILMSGDPEWAAAHGLAPDRYLAKPFELRHLLRLVRGVLAGPAGGRVA
jgi:DNA-binding NtrC family response regulator